MSEYIKNPEKLIAAINSFVAFMKYKDNGRPLSFVDKNNFLGSTKDGEIYKSENAVLAGIDLKYDEWKESWIGTGKISERCKKAMSRAGNLVHPIQQARFKDILTSNHERFKPGVEKVLYEIYKSVPGEGEKESFRKACETFGNVYEVIAYLFFVKDSSRFLPVRTGKFQESLASIGIEYKLDSQCSWENYTGFIEIIKEIRAVMQKYIPDVEIRLIDAHSFLWILANEDFKKWKQAQE